MKFAEKIFERATVKGVADYLLYGMIPDREDRSYKTRLDDAELAYENVAKQYGEDGASILLSAANEMVNENASVYMELGLQAGFLLIADLFQNICGERTQAISSTGSDEQMIQKEQSADTVADIDSDTASVETADTGIEPETRHEVFRQFIRNRLNTALEDTLRKDRKYQESKQKAKAKAEKLTEDMFTHEQWSVIDDVLEESNASASEYGRAAYQQGFFDALDFFKDIRSMKGDSI